MKGIDEYLTDKQINEALDRMKVVCEDEELERLRFQDLGYGEKLKELGFDIYLEG
jgi:hypothetical protein